VRKRGHTPIRTCIGCRKKRKKGELVWLTQILDEVIRVNGKKPHQGRGFYLCPDLGCFNMAKKKKRGVEFLKAADLWTLRRMVSQRVKRPWIEEEGNDKE